MANLIRILGAIWALLGVGNILASPSIAKDDGLAALVLTYNFLLHILPGAAVYGIGARLSASAKNDAGRVPCPFCAEKIMNTAIVCPHCRKDVPRTAAEPAVPAASAEGLP